jgi:hypothetical protein
MTWQLNLSACCCIRYQVHLWPLVCQPGPVVKTNTICHPPSSCPQTVPAFQLPLSLSLALLSVSKSSTFAAYINHSQ